LHTLPGHATKDIGAGAACAFSADGRLLATGDAAGQLRLWEVSSGREAWRFDGHRAPVNSVDFSPDGRLLVAASEDAPCFVWDVAGDRAPAAAWDADRLWDDLADADARTAFRAVRRLAANPGPAVEIIRKNLKPAAARPTPERLRDGRAVWVLEWINSPESNRLLDELAGGAAGDRLTAEATAARDRLRRRGGR
jgi:WD40 repeat protein